MSANDIMIRAANLGKRYGRQQAVEQLTFAVQAGQICALLGPNGAGKTSTMRMLVGLAVPNTGAVRIADLPVSLGAPVLQRAASTRPRWRSASCLATPRLKSAGRRRGRQAIAAALTLELVARGLVRRAEPIT